MKLPLLIARRYFFSGKKRSFINLIALVSMLGVCIGTMALVVVLSVFNGLEDFNRQLFRTFDADFRIVPRAGKFFSPASGVLRQLQALPGVAGVRQVYEQTALLQYNGRRAVATVKAYDGGFRASEKMKQSVISGDFLLENGPQNLMVLGVGVGQALGVSPADPLTPVEVWFPRAEANLSLPVEAAFNQAGIQPGGLFALEQSYDDQYVFVPLRFAEQVFEGGERRTSLEISVRPDADAAALRKKLQGVLGGGFYVQNPDEQHASLYRAIQIEKLLVFVTLTLIMGIASFNIFFSLTMLTIEKRRDVATLLALGAERRLIRRIFLAEGSLVALSGAAVGLVMGVGLCVLQQRFGLLKMGLSNALVDAYPVRMQFSDLLAVLAVIIGITLAASWLPASRAARGTA